MENDEASSIPGSSRSSKRRLHASPNSSSQGAAASTASRRISKSPRAQQAGTSATVAGKASPGFKYHEVVRNKEDRKKMEGEDCVECRKYCSFVTLTEGEEGTKRLMKNTRHRCVHAKAHEDPAVMWAIDFPATQDDPQQKHLQKR